MFQNHFKPLQFFFKSTNNYITIMFKEHRRKLLYDFRSLTIIFHLPINKLTKKRVDKKIYERNFFYVCAMDRRSLKEKKTAHDTLN